MYLYKRVGQGNFVCPYQRLAVCKDSSNRALRSMTTALLYCYLLMLLVLEFLLRLSIHLLYYFTTVRF